MATLGYVRGSNGPDLAQIGANEQLVSHVGPNAPSTGNSPSGVFLASSVSGYVGRWGGAAVMRFGGWAASSDSAAPGALLFRTEEISPTVNYMDASGGQKLTASIVDGDGDPTIVAIPSSQIIALGAASRTAAAGIAMYQASAIDQDNESFYRKSISGTTLVTASGSSASNEGQLALQINGVYNVKPNKPSAIEVVGGPTERKPIVRARFSDANEVMDGVQYDRLESYRIEVWWGGTRQSNVTYTASPAERVDRRSQVQIAPLLPYDTPYTIVVFHRDRAGLESEGRSYSGTVFSGAAVDTPTTPTGRVTNPANPGNITAVYRSTGGLSANAVQVRRVNSSGNPIKTSPILARTVAPNASTAVTWSLSTFGTLANGIETGVQMRARDTGGNWSKWSDTKWFTTNAAPNIPTLYGPADGGARSTVPVLSVAATDDDQDSSALTVTIEGYKDGVLVGTYTAAHNPQPGDARVHSLLPPGITSGYGNYTWRARSYDGFLNSDWSPLWSFTYAAVPSVTITGPTSPISTSQPQITWTATDQNRSRIRGYDGGMLVYDSGEIPGTIAKNHIVSGTQGWIGGERWNNGESFDWVVSVRGTGGLWGDSDPLTLTLEYAPIDTLIIDGAAMAFPGMDGAHYNQVVSSVTTYPEGEFLGYHRRRVNITGEMGAEIPGTEINLPTQPAAGVTAFNDYHVVSGQWYRYYLWQEIEVGNDIVPSDVVSIDLMASWHGVVLFSNADPLASALWLKYGGERWEPHITENIIRRNVPVRSRRAPMAVVSGHRELTANGEHTFISTEAMSAREQLERLCQIADWQYMHHAPNGRPNGVCRRDGMGGSRGLMYATMNYDHNPRHTAESVSLDFEEYDFDPYAEVS